MRLIVEAARGASAADNDDESAERDDSEFRRRRSMGGRPAVVARFLALVVGVSSSLVMLVHRLIISRCRSRQLALFVLF